MKGLLGYGRYNDSPETVGCPRAKSDMTPCVARDGECASCDDGTCVGCGENAAKLLKELVFAATTPASADNSGLPQVGGRRVDRSLADFERSVLVSLADEQEKPFPDNALIAVLCNSVRLCREHADMMQSVLPDVERWQADRQALGNLLAVIFRDGGHRAAEIGNLTDAAQEAQKVVLATRLIKEVLAEKLAADCQRTAALVAGLRTEIERIQSAVGCLSVGAPEELHAIRRATKEIVALLVAYDDNAPASAPAMAAGAAEEGREQKR